MRADVLIIGAGLAGLACALASDEQASVIMINDTEPACQAASAWAQGGLAAALARNDTPALHARDTQVAGAGIADRRIVAGLTAQAPAAIALLETLGVPFDRQPDGSLALGLEAAHSRRRIVHAADHTGEVIVRALLLAAAARPKLRLITGLRAVELTQADTGQVVGAICVDHQGEFVHITARATVLACGGYGGLYARTTTPASTLGSGIALAAAAGAALADLEFVQFHPTALAGAADPMPLVSEAVRGEGALLVDERGQRFTDELAPRDIVARAICALETRQSAAFLDARALGAAFATRFPTVNAHCSELGLDPRCDLIPVTPAAHYTIGGVVTDAQGRTDIAGLWACGEVAATGLHGANRLASNSLMEALVFGSRAARDIGARSLTCALAASRAKPVGGRFVADPATVLAPLRRVMSTHVGVVRDQTGLMRAIEMIDAFARGAGPDPRIAQAAFVARAVASAALQRRESRGTHFRSDFPRPEPALAMRSFVAPSDGVLARHA